MTISLLRVDIILCRVCMYIHDDSTGVFCIDDVMILLFSNHVWAHLHIYKYIFMHININTHIRVIIRAIPRSTVHSISRVVSFRGRHVIFDVSDGEIPSHTCVYTYIYTVERSNNRANTTYIYIRTAFSYLDKPSDWRIRCAFIVLQAAAFLWNERFFFTRRAAEY